MSATYPCPPIGAYNWPDVVCPACPSLRGMLVTAATVTPIILETALERPSRNTVTIVSEDGWQTHLEITCGQCGQHSTIDSRYVPQPTLEIPARHPRNAKKRPAVNHQD